MHWIRFRLNLDDVRMEDFASIGKHHGHAIDCGDPECDKCNTWRSFIPMIDLEQPWCNTPIGALILMAVQTV